MTKKLRLMMTMLLMAVMGSMWAETVTETITLSEQGYANAQLVSSTQGEVVLLTFNQGTSSTAPAYYNTGTGVRVYAGGNMTVKADGKPISKVIVTFTKTNSPTISMSSDGTDTSVSGTSSPVSWEGDATEVYFNVTNSGQARISKVEVTYDASGSASTVAKPTISLDEGTYVGTQSVELSCATEGAVIYYTLDGYDPTTNSTQYNNTAIEISESCTLKAIAVKDNEISNIAKAIYTIIPTHQVVFSVNGTPSDPIEVGEGSSVPFPTQDPEDVGDYKFIGWSSTNWTGEINSRPSSLIKYATMGSDDMTIYAVYAFATGTPEKWKKISASEVTEEGTYAILTSTEGDNAYHAFNGKISSGHGQTTPQYFVFDTEGYADSAPEGTLELVFRESGEGFLMCNPDPQANGSKPYLCASKAASGGLTWLASGDDYWSYTDGNWTYSKYFSTNNHYAFLRQYDNTIRTYGSNSGRIIEFAQKTGGLTYSNYCTIVDKYEIIDFATDGYKTYVTQNPIDWEATLERNNSDIDVHGYKAIAFSVADGVSLVEFGKENLPSVAATDVMYQEPITPAETPMIIMGKQGKNYLVISPVTTASAPTGNLFRKGDGVATTTLKADGEIDVALYVMQKIDVNGSGIDNYKFYKLTPGRTVPVGKAYLSGNDITLPSGGSINFPVNSKSSFPMRVLEQEDEQLVSEDAGIVDGIGMNYQECKDKVYYNVNGMRIANPSKGIYIVNGHKVVLK